MRFNLWTVEIDNTSNKMEECMIFYQDKLLQDLQTNGINEKICKAINIITT